MCKYRDIVDQHLSLHKITVRKFRLTASGRAWSKSRIVEIPLAINAEKFLVCMHEIGHVVMKHCSISKPIFIKEYEAEQYAIRAGRFNNVPEKDLNKYIVRARGYVTMKIAKAYIRGLSLDKIPQEIKEWLCVDFTEWNNKYVLVSRNKDEFLIRTYDKETKTQIISTKSYSF